MTKTQATALFNTVKDLAEALNITPSAVYQWPEDLPRRLADEILGAALRCKRITPEQAVEWFCDPGSSPDGHGSADEPNLAPRVPSVARLVSGQA